jgi:hypothetical protein
MGSWILHDKRTVRRKATPLSMSSGLKVRGLLSHSNCADDLAEHDLPLTMKYDPGRNFYIVLKWTDVTGGALPEVFTNAVTRKGRIECQTLELIKYNQKAK